MQAGVSLRQRDPCGLKESDDLSCLFIQSLLRTCYVPRHQRLCTGKGIQGGGLPSKALEVWNSLDGSA